MTTRRLTSLGVQVETQLDDYRRLTALGVQVETQPGQNRRLTALGVMVETVVLPYVSESDSVSVSETVALAVSESQITVSDSIGVGESVNASVYDPNTYLTAVSDNVSVSELVVLRADISVDISDSISLSELVEVSVGNGITVSDITAVSDSSSLFIPEYRVSVSDNISSAESISILVYDPNNYLIGVSEPITVGEEFSVVRAGARVYGPAIQIMG